MTLYLNENCLRKVRCLRKKCKNYSLKAAYNR